MEKRKRNGSLWFMIAYMTILFLFSGYVCLETFVFSEKIQVVESNELVADPDPETSESGAVLTDTMETEDDQPVITETSYQSKQISIEISEESYLGTTIHVAEVIISNPSLLKTAFAQNIYGRNITETVREQAESNQAILAINGDYYGTQRSGYVIRNGVVYRSRAGQGREDLCILSDGDFLLFDEREFSTDQLIEMGAMHVLSFGPGLINEHQVIVDEKDEVARSKVSNPRTAIAMVEKGHYLFVVSDGRTNDSEGLSLYELACYLQQKGVSCAYNLDGGGSSTMVFLDKVINYPTTNGSYSERTVSDIVYIGE